MLNNKHWWQSIGVWGGVVAVAAPIVGAVFHVTITQDDMQQTVNLLVGAADLIGGALAIYGRVAATKQIG